MDSYVLTKVSFTENIKSLVLIILETIIVESLFLFQAIQAYCDANHLGIAQYIALHFFLNPDYQTINHSGIKLLF